MEITVLSAAEMATRVPAGANYLYSALLSRVGETFHTIVASADGGPLPPRTELTVSYLRALVSGLSDDARRDLLRQSDRMILFQAADDSVDLPSIAYQSLGQSDAIRLIPDLYYFTGRGYEAMYHEVPAWADRKPVAFWRGSATGDVRLSMESLDRLPRYRLCRAARGLGDVIDAGLVGIVQATSPAEHDAILARCKAEGLMGGFVPQDAMTDYQFLIDIDGNTNAWNAIARYRMGCCILRVESGWRQWFHNRIEPWRHYVPVREDLSDLGERIAWCRTHSRQAAAIAAEGRAFAMAMRFDDEMAAASRTLSLL